jgi:mannose-1-phosphate guanylyltransferase
MASTSKQHLFAVILAGGGGTRLWPRSTTTKPKQFLRLISDKTMLQETYSRIKPIIPPERVIVVTSKRHVKLVQSDLPDLPPDNIFGEPDKKNTAMAMGVGAVLAHHLDPEAVVINLAADALIKNVTELRSTLLTAATAAQLGNYLITVGIHPTFPHTGLGYIKVADEFKRINGMHVFTVDSFTEKPKKARAKAFIATGKYFWNANNYVWTAQSVLDAFQKHLPITYRQLIEIEGALGTKKFKEVVEKAYQKVDSISIDYGVSEKARNLLLVPGDFGWNDIGDWGVVYDLSKKDASGNVVDKSRREKPVLLEVNGCFISGGKKLLAAAGVDDLVVVETKKALLLVPRTKSQLVRQIVNEIKSQGLTDYL